MGTEVATRRTRPHGQRTRRRILDATIECLVEHGYAGTTTVMVQTRAGVTRGSLLHHFPSRDELLVAAVAHLADVRWAELVDRLSATKGNQNHIDAAVEAMWRGFDGPGFFAVTELWLAARTHPELRAVLEPAERDVWRRYRAGYNQVFGPHSRHPRFDEMLNVLVNGMRGVALTRNFSDHSSRTEAAHLRSWKRLAHEMLESA